MIREHRKKIFIISLIGRGGTYQCVSIIASNLAGKTETSILIPNYSKTDLINKRIHIHKTPAPTSFLKTFIYTFNIFQHIKNIRLINTFHPEIILFSDIHPWYVLYWPFLKAKKKISIIHDVDIHEGESSKIFTFILQRITNFLIKKSDKTIVLSNGQKNILKRKIPEEKIILSKHGHFDFYTKYQDNKIKTESKTILFFGRIKDYKGLGYLLEALDIVNSNGINFKLIIAGEGEIKPYKEQIKKLGTKVELYNEYVTDEDTAKYFQRASFVVLPYTDATQTGIVPIAYSFKKPVIATNVGGLPEVVTNGETGIIIKPKNTKELSEAIIKMLKDPTATRKKGINAYKFMKKELNWKKIAKKLWEDMF